MKITPRIVSVFLPLSIAPLIFSAFAAMTVATEGITGIAKSLLEFKSAELVRFSSSQAALLRENGLFGNPPFMDAAERSIASFGSGLVRNDTELIFAADSVGKLRFSNSEVEETDQDSRTLGIVLGADQRGWRELNIFGQDRVAFIDRSEDFGLTFFVTERRETYYAPVQRIALQGGLIAAVSLVSVVTLILIVGNLITRPLKEVVQGMRLILSNGELDRRVKIKYDDETGDLANAFNTLTASLSEAYDDIKSYALKSAIAHRREMKIRNVFQKFVPNQVIENFFSSPDTMLEGDDRDISIVFSDIRDFTGLSEGMSSREIVAALNHYFDQMVEAILNNDGVVDKYIGDGMMAIFGAPAPDDKSAYHSVIAGFEMIERLDRFNEWHVNQGRKPIEIGIGINYGNVTVGNIGTERKMDYTVVGDSVNVASRLEGLTKVYQQPMLISESVRRRLGGVIPCRLMDRVQVKGRTQGVAIYAPKRQLSESEVRGWKLYMQGLQSYYNQDFDDSLAKFSQALEFLPDDHITSLFIERSKSFIRNAPPDGWDGIIVYNEK